MSPLTLAVVPKSLRTVGSGRSPSAERIANESGGTRSPPLPPLVASRVRKLTSVSPAGRWMTALPGMSIRPYLSDPENTVQERNQTTTKATAATTARTPAMLRTRFAVTASPSASAASVAEAHTFDPRKV